MLSKRTDGSIFTSDGEYTESFKCGEGFEDDAETDMINLIFR